MNRKQNKLRQKLKLERSTIMKTNENKKPNNGATDNKKTKQRSEVGGQGAENGSEAPDRWWEGLTAAEKQFACDLYNIVGGWEGGGFAEIATGVEKVRKNLRAAFQRLSVAYDSAGVQSPGGGPERWRWN